VAALSPQQPSHHPVRAPKVRLAYFTSKPLTWSKGSRGPARVVGFALGLEQRTVLGSDGGCAAFVRGWSLSRFRQNATTTHPTQAERATGATASLASGPGRRTPFRRPRALGRFPIPELRDHRIPAQESRRERGYGGSRTTRDDAAVLSKTPSLEGLILHLRMANRSSEYA
jgi:hypothetical protein